MAKGNKDKTAVNEELELYKAKKRKVRKVTAIVTVSVIAATLAAILIGFCIYTNRLDKGEYLRCEIAASTQNTEIDGGMLNYYFNDIYNAFVDYYGSYVSYYGLDTSRPLTSQFVTEDQSWFEYFIERAKSGLTKLLAFYDEAIENEIFLTADEKSAVMGRAESVNPKLCGKGVSTADIYNVKLIEALSYKYSLIKEKEFTPTAEEIFEYYAENPKELSKADYYSFSVYYIEESAQSSGNITKSEAEELVRMVADAATESEFKDAVSKVLIMKNPSITQEEIDGEMYNLLCAGALCREGDELSEWLFSAEKGSALTLHDEETQSYTVYFLITPAYLDKSRTVNVSHILFSDERYGGRDKAKAMAEEIMCKLRESDNPEELLGIFALEYSEDVSTYYSGGKCENIKPGYTLEAFDKWCFDEDRKAGELSLVESDLGWHIVYFAGEGLIAWQADASDAIISDRLSDFSAKLTEKHPVIFDERVVDMIPDPCA